MTTWRPFGAVDGDDERPAAGAFIGDDSATTNERSPASRRAKVPGGRHRGGPARPDRRRRAPAPRATGPTPAGPYPPIAMIGIADPVRADTDLAAGTLRCPGCAGALQPWGHARTRTVRDRGTATVVLRPRRARCPACRATHVLRPAVVSARRGVRSRTSAPIPWRPCGPWRGSSRRSSPTLRLPSRRFVGLTARNRALLVQAARDIADGLDATALVAFTLSGNTVRQLARLHPGRPLIAITPNPALTESARAELGDGARPRRGRRVVRCDGADRRPGGAGVGRIRPG